MPNTEEPLSQMPCYIQYLSANINISTRLAAEEVLPPTHKCSNRFLGQLICQLFIGPGLVLHFL